MNLFLDSNVWLALYDSPRRDLDELGKLVRLVETGSVTLLLPDQVVNEVRRNRDKKVANDIEELQSEVLVEEVPPIFFSLQEHKSFAQTRRNRTRLSPFLEEEWRERKGGRVFFFTRLSAFCCEHLPEVRLAGEGEAAEVNELDGTKACFRRRS